MLLFWHFLIFTTHDIMSKNESCQKLFILHVDDHVARAIFFMCRAVSPPLMTTSYDMIKSQQKVPKKLKIFFQEKLVKIKAKKFFPEKNTKKFFLKKKSKILKIKNFSKKNISREIILFEV